MNSRYIIVAILMHSLFGSSIAMAAEQNDLLNLKQVEFVLNVIYEVPT